MEQALFNIFKNYLELGESTIVVKFADKTKLFQIVKTKADCEELYGDFHKLSGWVTFMSNSREPSSALKATNFYVAYALKKL